MTLTTGTLRLGTAGSPTTVIRYEILGAYGSYKITTADIATGQGNNMRAYAGYSHASWGRGYGSDNIASQTAYIKRLTHGGTYQLTSGATTLKFTGDRNEWCDGRRTQTISYTTGNAVSLDFYRRTKQTSGSWSFQNHTESYASQDKYCLYDTYDFWFDLFDDEGCLTGENNIYISPSLFKNIKDIKAGDMVYTAPPNDPYKLGYYEVYNVRKILAEKVATVTLDTGNKIRCSPSHKFMVATQEDTFEGNKLYMLETGNAIMRIVDGEYLLNRIVSIEFSDKPEYVYHIEVEEAHTYFTDGFYFHHNEK